MNVITYLKLWILFGISMCSTSAKQDCVSNSLLDRGNSTPSLTIGDGIVIKLRIRNQVEKGFVLNALLEDDNEQTLYELEMTETLSHNVGDMNVTLQDSITNFTVLKVQWPPVLIPQAWTTLYLRLHHRHLLQLAIIPNEAIERPTYYFPFYTNPKPTAASAHLKKSGVTKLRLKLPDGDTSVEYSVNCDQELFATSFSEEFGIQSSVAIWRSMAWISLGIVGILSVVLILIFIKTHRDKTKNKPNTYTLKRVQSENNGSVAPGPVMVSSTRSSKREMFGGRTEGDNTLHAPPPCVTVGVVSSRAPSPGHETDDDDSIDYVNKVFSSELQN